MHQKLMSWVGVRKNYATNLATLNYRKISLSKCNFQVEAQDEKQEWQPVLLYTDKVACTHNASTRPETDMRLDVHCTSSCITSSSSKLCISSSGTSLLWNSKLV